MAPRRASTEDPGARRRRPTAAWLALMVPLLALSACDVEQTQAGDLPDVDVDVEGGELPEYRVNWADVDVTMEERTVEVPKIVVVTEKETVSVPVIDVNMDGDDVRERTLTAEVEVPHAGYALNIESVVADQENDEVVVIAHLDETDPGQAEGTARVSDRVVLRAPDVDVRYVVLGDRPEGIHNESFEFYASEAELPASVRNGRELYSGGGEAIS